MNNSAGTPDTASVIFPELVFTQPGVYTYRIKELSPSGGGWTTDEREFPVIITVRENQQGRLAAFAEFPVGAPVFVNTYSGGAAEVCLSAFYCPVECRRGETASFGVFDRGGALVSRAESDDGAVAFPCITLTEPGVYEYSVSMLAPCAGTQEYRVAVTVTRGEGGGLTAEAVYLNGRPYFTGTTRR